MICFEGRVLVQDEVELKVYGEVDIKSFLGELGFVVKFIRNWFEMKI